MEIKWKKGARVKVDADIAYREFEKIRAKHGELNNKVVVEEVKKTRNPLHHEWEWDVKKAAQQSWENRASELLRWLIVIYKEDTKGTHPVRKYSLEKRSPSPHAYVPTEDILKDPDRRALLLQESLRKLMSWRMEYRHLNELTIIFRSHDELLSEIGEKV